MKTTYSRIFYNIFCTFLGLIYITFLSLMPNEWFRDRDNYLIYANSSDIIMNSYSGFVLFFNEPLFLLLNNYLNLFLNYNYIPNLYVFLFATAFFIGLKKYSKNFITFILGILLSLTVPYMLQSELVALRQSIGTAVLIFSFLYVKSDKKLALIILLCSFIHSIFFLFFAFFILNFILLKELSLNKKIIINFVLMVVFSVFSIALAKFFGLRQGDEYAQNMNVEKSGGAFILFLGVFIYLHFFTESDDKRLHAFAMLGLVIFLTAYFLTPISGRLFNTIIPFVIFLLVSKSRFQDLLLLIILFFIFFTLFILGSYNDLLAISEIELFSKFNLYIRNFISL